MSVRELSTERLRLRAWCDDDLEPWAALNGDAEAMRYFQRPYDRAESDRQARDFQALLDQRGWGLWAVEVPGVAPFVGTAGLHVPGFTAHFTPCVEVGWRFWRPYFGHGYATEAGRAALQFAFDELGLDEIVSMTAEQNAPSRAVMERLGMSRDPAEDFDHPRVAPDSHVYRHVLYRIGAGRFRELAEQSAVVPRWRNW
jgi:ribosomal-protein-alanine N-acetyltransferase